MELNVSDLIQLIAILGIITAVVYGVLKFVQDFMQSESRKRENYLKSFDTVVAQLSSDVKTSQLSAAILMRRYFKDTKSKKRADLRIEAINVISSLLKVLPTGVLQKTLGDGLAYASDLTKIDLQGTNLQNLYLGRKDDVQIIMEETDMFMADLSYATLNNIVGHGTVFLNAILYHTQIKECDFTGAYFKGADLSNAYFKNVQLYGANFSQATNLPIEFEQYLSEDGIFTSREELTTPSTKQERKTVFFSMPGCLSKKNEIITMNYRDFLENKGYTVIYYNKDEYPEFGQFNKIRQSHPDTNQERTIENKHMSTYWNELEVGMGLMNNLPILLVKDPAIDNGVFDSKLSEVFVATTTVDYDVRELEYNPAVKTWMSEF